MRDLLPFLRLYRQHAGLLGAGMLLTLFTLLAGIGLLSLSGWFLSASAVAGLSLAGRQDFNYLFPAGAVRFLSIVRTASRWGDRVVSHDATFRLLTRLRILFWDRLAPLPAGRLQAYRQADLLNRLVADIDAMDHVYLRLISPLVTGLLSILGMFALLRHFDVALGWVLLGCLLVCALLLPAWLYRLGLAPGQALTHNRATLRTSSLDLIANQAELQMFDALGWQRQQWETAEAALIESQRRMSWISGLASCALTVSGGLLMLLMLVLASDGVGGRAPDPLIALVVFLSLAAFEAIAPLAGAFQHLATSLSAARRLNEVLHDTAPQHFGPWQREASRPPQLEWRQIEFSYPGDTRPTLKGLNLILAPGEHLAILGPTGCGKSTLLNLLLREWEPSAGELLLDGQPLASLDETSLRRTFAVVSQRVDLFSATLADNLRLAAPDASNEALQQVLTAVGLDHLLIGPDVGKALTLWLGEGGRPLSGGELRRLGLARALLHQAPVMLLDEVTEGLDPRTEQEIQSLIQRHCQGRSVLMITHRARGLAQMDRIVLLEQGRIAHSGSHAQLLAEDDQYRLWQQRLDALPT